MHMQQFKPGESHQKQKKERKRREKEKKEGTSQTRRFAQLRTPAITINFQEKNGGKPERFLKTDCACG